MPIMIYFNAFWEGLNNMVSWTWKSITFDVPWYNNFFWGIIVLSLVVWFLEILFPWRKDQKIIRKDFWLDVFYIFFNFFIFAIIISGVYQMMAVGFQSIGINMDSLALIDINQLPAWASLLIFFIVLDFVQWFTHILLHRVPAFWQFHKVHHSVKEMGFAAHMRFHWMENILYKPLKTLGVMVLGGFEPEQAYVVHFVAIAIGHFNHSNIKLSYGPLKYILNNPIMHLYHHAYYLPENSKYGVNYGISLSIWDYIFKTNYIPEASGTIKIGFKGDEDFPKDFVHQNIYGFSKDKRGKNSTL